MPGSGSTRASGVSNVLKPRRYQGKFVTVGVKPGETLPAGIYHNAWKLDRAYGPNVLYIIFEPED